MRIFIRADASVSLGGGHLMRCLALADELVARKCEVTFICRDLPGNLFPLLQQKAYSIWKLPGASANKTLDWQDDAAGVIACIKANGGRADWVIVDHYELDAHWESSIRKYAGKIMVIDDLANRPHDCDLLLDQNYYADLATRYDRLLPPNCLKLLGPQYVLLRPEFEQARQQMRKRDGHVKRILVFFGATDPGNHTEKALMGIGLLDRPDISVDVVVGATNPHRERIRALCSSLPNAYYFCQVSNMSALMQQADLAVGAGGATTWERCILGLPAATVVLAENQLRTTVDLADLGVIWFLGRADSLAAKDYAQAILKGINSPSELAIMSKKAMALMAPIRSAGIQSITTALLSMWTESS